MLPLNDFTFRCVPIMIRNDVTFILYKVVPHCKHSCLKPENVEEKVRHNIYICTEFKKKITLQTNLWSMRIISWTGDSVPKGVWTCLFWCMFMAIARMPERKNKKLMVTLHEINKS